MVHRVRIRHYVTLAILNIHICVIFEVWVPEKHYKYTRRVLILQKCAIRGFIPALYPTGTHFINVFASNRLGNIAIIKFLIDQD